MLCQLADQQQSGGEHAEVADPAQAAAERLKFALDSGRLGSWALDTDQRGITSISGIWLAEGAPADGSDGCAAYPEGSLMWTLCQHDPTADQAVPDGG